MPSPFKIGLILFPTDFSKSSEAAGAYASALARQVGAKVSILNVVPSLSAWHGVPETHFSAVSDDALRKIAISQEATEAANLESLKTFRDQVFAGVETDVAVRVGGVADTVVDYAGEIGADLIMMPTRGLGPGRRFLIGSTTARVLHDSPCPVWTSPHVRELDPFRPYKNIACALDYRKLDREVLASAAEISKLFGSSLSVVSAVPYMQGTMSSRVDHDALTTLMNETKKSLKSLVSELNLKAAVHVCQET